MKTASTERVKTSRELGADAEREAIVAYLRAEMERAQSAATEFRHKGHSKAEYVSGIRASVADQLADTIERGAHIKDQDHGRA